MVYDRIEITADGDMISPFSYIELWLIAHFHGYGSALKSTVSHGQRGRE
jgi:hypothetical protein